VNRPLIDGTLLLERIGELASIGILPSGGVTRDSFSGTFVAGRELLTKWFTDAGLEVSVDAAGNLLGRLAGAKQSPVLMIGSHLDTVTNGGALDGAYGILGGLSALGALKEAGVLLDHPVVLAAFVNEEGARGTPAMTGSRAIVGDLTPNDLEIRDNNGRTVADLITDIGGEPQYLAEAAWLPGSIAAYLELHVEQGPVLEQMKKTIGVVTAITGRALVDLVVTGKALHAGTTPMKGRSDALVAAARLVLAIESLGDNEVRVATTGTIHVEPASRNTIPGRVVLCSELRDDETRRILQAIRILEEFAQQLEESSGVSVAVTVVDVVGPCPTSSELQQCIAVAAIENDAPSMQLLSGAGHDAQSFHGYCPIGMLFVPSVGGVSHAPDEATDPEDLIRGATVLAQTLVLTDRHFSVPTSATSTR